MKFFAFLHDSYKEAVSGWLLQITLILAVIFNLLVASMSFTPVSLKDDLEPKLEAGFVFVTLLDPSAGQATFSIENYKQTNVADPWNGDYSFDVVMRCPTVRQLKQAMANRQLPSSRERLEETITGTKFCPYLKGVRVEEGKMEDGKAKSKQPPLPPTNDKAGAPKDDKSGEDAPMAIRFAVTTQGTKITDRLAWVHKGEILFGAIELPSIMSLREWVFNLQTTMMNDFGAWALLLIGVIATAGFVPTIMRKGAVDLIISKPINRFTLLIYKYFGGMTFVLLLVTSSVLGAWVVIGIRYNFWSPNFLALIPIITFYFAILYSVSLLLGVLTRSTVVAIMITLIAWCLFTLIGWGNNTYHQRVEAVEEFRKQMDKLDSEVVVDNAVIPRERLLNEVGPGMFTKSCHYLHIITPHTYDLDKLAARVTAQGILTDLELQKRKLDKPSPVSVWQIFANTIFCIGLMLGLAYWRFATRDG